MNLSSLESYEINAYGLLFGLFSDRSKKMQN